MNLRFKESYRSKLEPSESEKIIIRELEILNIYFLREVCFEGLVSSNGYPLYVDFYIPSYNLALEYDGKEYHKTSDQKKNDSLKNKFFKKNGVKLKRLGGSDFYNMDKIFLTIFKKHKVKNKKKVCPDSRNERILRRKTKKKKLSDVKVTIDSPGNFYSGK